MIEVCAVSVVVSDRVLRPSLALAPSYSGALPSTVPFARSEDIVTWVVLYILTLLLVSMR